MSDTKAPITADLTVEEAGAALSQGRIGVELKLRGDCDATDVPTIMRAVAAALREHFA